jgi:hypothetical protein
MNPSDDNDLVCSHCRNEINADDDFCPHCGAMFAEALCCHRHKKSPADGVCIICALAYCGECGTLVQGRFLCNRHGNYEIYEGLARVFGVLDDVAAQFAKSCLDQAGLHPLLYCRRQPRGGPRFVYTLYAAAGDFDGHIINEIKVMVPCREVPQAEKVLKDLNIAASISPDT